MSKKVKIAKEVLIKLKEIGEMLPPIPTSDKIQPIQISLTGAKAKEAGIVPAKGSGITEIEDNKIYQANTGQFVSVNHFKKLKELWISGQDKAVEKYVQDVKAKNLQLIEKRAEENAKPINTGKEVEKIKQDLKTKSEMAMNGRKKNRESNNRAGKKRKPRQTGNKNTKK